ncbi:phosphatidylglycerophosphatase A family protein ['Paenibacillus yunnanensis' Narsing Rao et al. 2020]|uniref:phosphatidylglycerophosphatase A family protein n=1 Tax=Paenibacillus tengchongensis TaxID=2608684 RepID=UPI00124D9350|nr:phosphatidylglycerophosphatase A [Paenibacillus tengchongensis]
MSYQMAAEILERRGVTLASIVEIVYILQSAYYPDLTHEECMASVKAVLGKREVQYTLMTGVALDELAEQGVLPQPLQAVMEADESLYGADETLALGITGVYGMIGLTGFGYLDKIKLGIIGKLNDQVGRIHVFLDDLVAGIAAAASARIAHRHEGAKVYPHHTGTE